MILTTEKVYEDSETVNDMEMILVAGARAKQFYDYKGYRLQILKEGFLAKNAKGYAGHIYKITTEHTVVKFDSFPSPFDTLEKLLKNFCNYVDEGRADNYYRTYGAKLNETR
jgi:hypothetical protein